MKLDDNKFNRQIGRNSQLLAQAVGRLESPEARYPYLRVLVNVIEQARPDWALVQDKEEVYRHLIVDMSGGTVPDEEILEAVRARDAERSIIEEVLSTPAGAQATAPMPAAPEENGASEH